jgi:transforming growth factor-beta-induced protein
MFNKISLLSAFTLALAGSAMAQQKDIVDTAVANGKFTTLVKLVQEAGLVDALKGKGPFTVLAPTDEAFAKLPKDLLAKVGSDKELLKKVLTYHVIPGQIMSSALKNRATPKSLQGENITVMIDGKVVRFNNAKVLIADVKTSNGVIHAIDTVILPPSVVKALAK